MRIIVGGTRTFDDYKLLCETMDALTRDLTEIEIVSGAQKLRLERAGDWVYVGADYLGEQWAYHNKTKKITVVRFHADWDKYGRHKGSKAGPIRNQEMVDYTGPSGAGVWFWDGLSPGTKDCITKARKVIPAKRIKIVRF